MSIELSDSLNTELRATSQDTVTHGEYHFLDVGDEKYGECILVVFDSIRILFDGSHQGDFRGRNGHQGIPEQLGAILGDEAPHQLTLIVVTHGHADHIGCLPDLVSEGVVKADWAFITDPKLGFGRTAGDSTPDDGAADARQRIVAAMREEDASDLNDDALKDFIDAVASVESRYKAFIDALEAKGTQVVRYSGQPLPAKLAAALKPTGAMLLGPTQEQLLYCAQQIGKTNKDAEDSADALLRADASMDDAALYRASVALSDGASDAAASPRGSGMNCQSITFAFGPKNARVLLAGDMQFAEPGVKGADEEVRRLRERVVAAGPYKVFKTTHHTSHNGQDDDWLSALGDPPIIVHSGGLNDASHPYPGVLKILQKRRASISFARTDRNGLITVRPHLNDADAIEVSRGRLNNFTDNARDAEGEEGAPFIPARQAKTAPTSMPAHGMQVVIVNLPPGPIDMTVRGVDIVVRAPGPVSPSNDSRPTPGPPRDRRAAISSPPVSLASSRPLPTLMFVTNPERLAANIGRAEAAAALGAVRASRATICEVDGSAADAAKKVRTTLLRTSGVVGLVLLGGYDVVPSNIVDVLSPELRRALGAATTSVDADNFVVWSDEAYGDTDGDRVGELPVSRIPDGHEAAFFLGVLGGAKPGGVSTQRFGIRNLVRPFAEDVWQGVPGNSALNVSERFLSSDADADTLAEASLHYFMLHGDWHDGRRFSGESAGGTGYTNAFGVGNVPARFSGVAFSGCCWGALTTTHRALDAGTGPPEPKSARQSIALAYLQAGAIAFVGCTGSHYSGPDTDPDANYAARMHHAFWGALPTVKFSGATALHQARKEYSAWIAQRAETAEAIDLARYLKNRAQFTCLGLGW